VRGGQYWLEPTALAFDRLLCNEPLRILFSVVTGTRVRSWHAGAWWPVIPFGKIDWTGPEGTPLCIGIGMRHSADADPLVAEMQRRIKENQRGARQPSMSLQE
jgi:hypothetical protein